MASATPQRSGAWRKGLRVKEIRNSGFLKVSHLLRRCFIAAKTAKPETVRVTLHATKRGVGSYLITATASSFAGGSSVLASCEPGEQPQGLLLPELRAASFLR